MTKTLRKRPVLMLALLLVSACGSSSKSDDAACANIAGNYTVMVERVSGTCDPAIDPKTASVSMRKEGDGTWTAVLPGIEGGCPGKLDGCHFRATCEVKSAAGEVVATATADYAFSANGYTGSSVNGVQPPAVATACQVTYRETATKL